MSLKQKFVCYKIKHDTFSFYSAFTEMFFYVPLILFYQIPIHTPILTLSKKGFFVHLTTLFLLQAFFVLLRLFHLDFYLVCCRGRHNLSSFIVTQQTAAEKNVIRIMQCFEDHFYTLNSKAWLPKAVS
jgi:hypothetical protein